MVPSAIDSFVVSSFSLERGNNIMALKLSKNLMKMAEERKKIQLDKEESSKPRLIINMGGKKKTITSEESNEEMTDNLSLDEIIEYVRRHTSGKKEHYDLAEGGSIMVTFDKFVEMVNEGYNIYYSEVLSRDFISIRYQKEIKREGRGR